jgi:hypothetical protein
VQWVKHGIVTIFLYCARHPNLKRIERKRNDHSPKRATPSQALLLRIIEGAIKNTCDAHPDLVISKQYRHSIAKRAAGTISALNRDVGGESRQIEEG